MHILSSKLQLTVLTVFFVAVMSPVCWASTYYVSSSSGNDSNSGLSSATAWTSVAKVNSSRFLPGDQILFKRGERWNNALVPSTSGTLGNPIVFGSFGSGALPIIGETNARAIDINDKSYITMQELELHALDRCISIGSWSNSQKQGITIVNNVMVSSAHGIYVTATSGGYDMVTISDNVITPGHTALWQMGINFVVGVSNFVVSNNTIKPAGEDAIMIHKSSNGVISGNTLAGNVENSIDVKNSHDIVISHNNCSDDGEANIVIHDADTAPNNLTYNITVEYNHCLTGGQGDRAKQGYRIYAGIFAQYVDRCIIRNNWIEKAYGSGIFMTDLESASNNNEITGNVIVDCGTGTGSMPQAGIELGDCVGTKVYNNTIFNQQGTGGYGIYAAGGTHTLGIKIINNIVHTTGGDLIRVLAAAQSGFVSDYNCFYPNNTGKFFWGTKYLTGFADWQLKTASDTHSISSDPKFADIAQHKFYLGANSPCKGTGSNVGLNTDFNGNDISSLAVFNMGAFQFGVILHLQAPQNFRFI